MRAKKGQYEGKAVGVLILIIALFMVLYILFVPPEERDKILNPENITTDIYSSSEKLELLAEAPGLVSPLKKELTEHNLLPVNLYIKSEPNTVNLAQSVSVQKGTFSTQSPKLHFNVDMKDLKKVSLFFSVSEPLGELRITINKNSFFAEELKPGVKIIEIPLTFIQEKDNELSFEVSSPGIAFWATNSYSLSDIGLKEEFELINSKEERTFNLPKIEKDSLESAQLSFFQVCNMKLPKQTVPLKIYLNDNPSPIISTRIRCTSYDQALEIDPADLISGQNKLLFVLEEAGDFTLNEVSVKTDSKQSDYPSYTFGVSTNQYNDIKAGTKKIMLEMNVDNNDNKQSKNARISVNSGDIFMQEKSNFFSYDLKDYIVQNSNFMRIVPSNEFTINGLKVTLQ